MNTSECGGYRSLSEIVAQPKKWPFGVNSTTEVEHITTSDNEQHLTEYVKLTSVPLLSHVVIFLDMICPTVNTILYLFYDINLTHPVAYSSKEEKCKFSVGHNIYFLLEIQATCFGLIN
jgi:hypothetical protein